MREAGREEASLEVTIIITQVGNPLVLETASDIWNEESVWLCKVTLGEGCLKLQVQKGP